MNYSQFRQYLFNNLRHGEQKGRSKIASTFAVYSLIQPDYTRVWGTDISGWDKNVQLSATKERGASFVFIKAIDGTIQNSYFVPNRARAIDAGLLHAPYGWLYRNANVSCVAQAQAYSNIVKQYPSDLPPIIDFEWTSWGGQSANTNYDDLRKWVVEWLRLGNRKPILYSAAGFMNSYGKIPADLKAMFEGIWIANYGVNNPAMPTGYAGDEWLFHQFTSSGDAPHLSPNDAGKLEVDLNYFRGGIQSLYQLSGGMTPPTEEPPTNGGSMHRGTTNQVAKVWDFIGGTNIDDIPAGTTVEGNAPSGGYAYITSPAQYRGYTKTIWLSNYNLVTTPPPPPPPPVEPPATFPLPATIQSTQVMKDDAGNVLATYSGTLTKQ